MIGRMVTCLLCFSLAVRAQQGGSEREQARLAAAQDSDRTVHAVIQNSRTAAHLVIPGTAVSMIPRGGYRLATEFPGLRKNKNAYINIIDKGDSNFYSDTATFNQKTFAPLGIQVVEYKRLLVDGYPARYIRARKDTVSEYLLLFGDSSFSTMVVAVCPEADVAAATATIGMLNSLCYERDRKTYPLDSAAFSLDMKGSLFRMFQYKSGFFVYTMGGMDSSPDPGAPYFIVTQLPMDSSMNVGKVAEMMLTKMQQAGLSNLQIYDLSTASINNYPAYELKAKGERNGQSADFYECVVTKGSMAIVMEGIAVKDAELVMPQFSQLAHSVRVK